MNNVTVGEMNLKIRNDIGLSRKYIAEMAGVSEVTCMHFERGYTVRNESDVKLRRAYRNARNIYSKRNREAYMAYIRNYLASSKIGIVEFSKMVKTGSDIYRDPKMKSRILATADQIIKIETATGINYKEYLDSCEKEFQREEIIAVAKPGTETKAETIDAEVTPTKSVECTTIGYSMDYCPDGSVKYRKRMRRVITEIIEVDVTADELRKTLEKGGTV